MWNHFESKRIYYTIKGKGTPLLLLHGDAASSKMFDQVMDLYKKHYKVILIDFPGSGKSEHVQALKADYYYFNSKVCFNLLKELQLDKVAVIGTSGGAIVGLNLALEHPEKISFLIADSFEGEYPMEHYIEMLESDREKSKRSFGGKLFYFWNHGFGWQKAVDANTRTLMDFYKTGRSFYHKPIETLSVPTLLTGSREDEFCDHLEEIYKGLESRNRFFQIHMFNKGGHPAMISNRKDFFSLVRETIKL